jgi:hypothetical protein
MHSQLSVKVTSFQPFYAAFSAGRAMPKIHRDSLPTAPRNWKDMQAHPHAKEFRAAAQKEHDDLLRKKVFEYVNSGYSEQKPLPLMWVFTYKFDPDGFLIKHKARLCARGDLQETTDETYAATLAAQTFRFMMAIAAYFDLEVWQYDAVNAFANSTLDPPILCRCPDGFEGLGRTIWLLMALYGLKVSPLLWYREFTATLADLGLSPVPGVNCLYTNGWLTLLFYVDDVILFCSTANLPKMRVFEAELLKRYEFRKLGEIDHFLGIRVIRDRASKKVWLLQDAYISKIVAKYNVKPHQTKPKTPLPTTPLMTNPLQASKAEIYEYQQKVGSINYSSVITRADIARAVSKLSEFLQNPSREHLFAVDQTILYLDATKFYAILYDGSSIKDHRRLFLCASDASFADNLLTRFSSQGYIFTLFGGIIHYRATKQKTVTTSSTEAELLALQLTAGELMWWMRFFKAIHFELDEPFTILCDNQQTLRLLNRETPKLVTKLRHVDVHQSWLRQEVQKGTFKTEWVPTSQMPADGFTKELPRQKHEEFVRQLGLVDLQHTHFDGAGKLRSTKM